MVDGITDDPIQFDEPTSTTLGVVHVTSPNPVRNTDLMAALRQVLHRPAAPPTPALLARVGAALLRTDPALALTGRRCVPGRLRASGLEFRFPDLVPALEDVLTTDGT